MFATCSPRTVSRSRLLYKCTVVNHLNITNSWLLLRWPGLFLRFHRRIRNYRFGIRLHYPLPMYATTDPVYPRPMCSCPRVSIWARIENAYLPTACVYPFNTGTIDFITIAWYPFS